MMRMAAREEGALPHFSVLPFCICGKVVSAQSPEPDAVRLEFSLQAGFIRSLVDLGLITKDAGRKSERILMKLDTTPDGCLGCCKG